MKRIIILYLFCVTFFSTEGLAQGKITRHPSMKNATSRTKTTPTKKKGGKSARGKNAKKNQMADYVDLGLPSDTQWKSANEDGFYDYNTAVNKYRGNLPTKEQLEELISACRWSWNGSGYKVTGPNGNSIVLPAEGYRNCSGGVGSVGSCGNYWSSTPDEYERSFSLCFDSGSVDMDSDTRCYGLSVRLVLDIMVTQIFFAMHDANITDSERGKVENVIKFLKANPETKVTIKGFAEARGNPRINMKYSQNRAESVAKALIDAGIEATRIRVEAKGDLIQFSDGYDMNRVIIVLSK